ncbi:MAG TPA: thioredoxin domain-containing protein [Methylomusa anaerophila]|uniref:Cellobiose 2-epimerase n=1 Tax=Methylomusa anaerophila TaxID=1930071 RepID=A0A348AMI8_9FIRM|nr:thioredoxin domain-containing protein [Methylomusa anaerophila]BBB92286.1 cellobiose 2-epimerase [Methylomusa anaerophila]HML90253.1 thioredoxin domain-containing protein [Methylomusa anaerophila]
MSEKHVNHLANEKSPYLLQHVHNPIDWYPWGEEAFAKAREEDKPVFFSCGYSTCHWCHVMERESFEDEDVAALLNRYYVAIKVDREERPDVDHIYMSVCQAVTGQGGWPLTIVMTPAKVPFFAGTYLPKHAQWGKPGLLEVLSMLKEQWDQNREKIEEIGVKLVQSIRLQRKMRSDSKEQMSLATLEKAFNQLLNDFDPNYGGFGPAPKFPTPHNLMFLLRYWRRTGDKKAIAMVLKTLDAMSRGGIYDHLGYGFARYSTDNKWLAPHFEKMLYDNALLCYTFVEAYQVTGDPDLAKIAEEIITYVLRDMTNEAGAFYSAEDADSEGVEGKFYVWTREEVIQILGPKLGELFADVYNISHTGNFEHGVSILNLIERDLYDYAVKHKLDISELERQMAQGREKLYYEREKRIHPFKDDKILTAWNGLMVAALAKAGKALQKTEYIVAAKRAVEFLFARLVRSDGRILARFRDGEAAHLGYVDDYAYLLWSIVELYESTFAPQYLEKALELYAEIKRLFWDDEQGGFFFNGADGEPLLIRQKEIYDGAMPSGNSVAALALLKLGRITENNEFFTMAEKMFSCFSREVIYYPRAYTYFLLALDYYLSVPSHIVIAGDPEDKDVQAMLNFVNRMYIPNAVVLFNNPALAEQNRKLLPAITDQPAINGKATAYICENFTCQKPITNFSELEVALKAYLMVSA